MAQLSTPSSSVRIRLERDRREKRRRKLLRQGQEALAKTFMLLDFVNKRTKNLRIDASHIVQKLKLSKNDPANRELYDYSVDLARNAYDELEGIPHETTGLTALFALDELLREASCSRNYWGEETSYATVSQDRVVWQVRKKAGQSADIRIAIVGSTQSGKTGVFATLYFLYPILAYVLSNGQFRFMPFINSPAFNDINKQTQRAVEGLYYLLKGVDFVNTETGFRCSIEEYWRILREHNLESSYGNSKSIFIRSTSKVKKGRDNLAEAHRAGFIPIAFIDEPHYGSAKGGNQDQLHQEFIIDGKKVPIMQVTIGATCDEQSAANADEWTFLPMVLGPGYVGPSHYNGEPLPYLEGYIPQDVEIECFYDYLCSKLDIVPSHLNVLKFFGAKKQTPAQQEEQVKILMELANYIIEVKKSCEALVYRISTSNSKTDKWIAIAKEKFPKLCEKFVFKKFYGDGDKEEDSDEVEASARALCLQAKREGKVAILLVTGKGRCGTVFPKSVGLFLNLCEDTKPRLTTIIQREKGRASGYGKQKSLILVSRRTFEVLDALRKTNYDFIKTCVLTGANPGWRTSVEAQKYMKKLGSKKTYNVRLLRSRIGQEAAALEALWAHDGRPLRVNMEYADQDPICKDIEVDNPRLFEHREPGYKGIQDRRIVHLSFAQRIKAALPTRRLRELVGEDVLGWGERAPKEVQQRRLTFDFPENLYELEKGLAFRRAHGGPKYGGPRYRFYNNQEEFEADKQGRQMRNIPKRQPGPQIIYCPKMGVICPNCGNDTGQTIIDYRTATGRHAISTGNWRIMMWEAMKRDGRLCCYNNSQIKILAVDVYNTKPLSSREKWLLTGEVDLETDFSIQGEDSRFSSDDDNEESHDDITLCDTLRDYYEPLM